eukprot:scaffold104827_cov63-Phaeocystis_antarctica.AAC.2
MAALRELNARQNQLTGLPASLGSLKNLEGLFLDRNCLEALPDLSGCVALAGINVSLNKLRGLPDGLCQCARMEGIFGDENEIAELPEHFGAMGALEEVSLNHNQLNLLRAHRAGPRCKAARLHGCEAARLRCGEAAVQPGRRRWCCSVGHRSPSPNPNPNPNPHPTPNAGRSPSVGWATCACCGWRTTGWPCCRRQ